MDIWGSEGVSAGFVSEGAASGFGSGTGVGFCSGIGTSVGLVSEGVVSGFGSGADSFLAFRGGGL